MYDIKSCIKILVMISKPTQLISICSTVNKELQGIHTRDLRPLRGKSGLNMYDSFLQGYILIFFVPGKLTEHGDA